MAIVPMAAIVPITTIITRITTTGSVVRIVRVVV